MMDSSTPLSMPSALAGLVSEPGSRAAPRPDHKKTCGGFIGTSAVMQKLYGQIERAARSGATVFITGETGTGKEVCAEAVHRLGARAGKPFVPLNCAAIPRDLMESELFGHVKGAFTGAIADREGAAHLASGGTLFLDEVAEMKPDMQSKLLRFLQNQTFTKIGSGRMEKTDVRIICATNRDPAAEIAAGRFREDLYYRLHVLPLHMPPLRGRGEDVVDIALTLLRHYAAEEGKSFAGFSDETEKILRRYCWPGNIRQLQNIIRCAVVMNDGGLLTERMLPPALSLQPVQESDPVPDGHILPLDLAERRIIERAIQSCYGNVPEAAARLGISPSTIYRKKATWDQSGAL